MLYIATRQGQADTAKEIKTLIRESIHRINAGSALVADAGNTVNYLVERVDNVPTIMVETMQASSEQSVDIEQVNQAVSLVDQATQQNAALVEEASAAANSLKDQVQHLAQLVSVFQLPGNAPGVLNSNLIPLTP